MLGISPLFIMSNLADQTVVKPQPDPQLTFLAGEFQVFRVSPLIWVTLLSLYLALTLPLPFLTHLQGYDALMPFLIAGMALGGLGLLAAVSERVRLDAETIQLEYPVWVPRFWRRGWSLPWSTIQDLKARSTGQGGLVYYLTTQTGEAFLLPIRVAGFAQMMRRIQAQTHLDTSLVRPLAQPWMYLTLLGFTLVMLLMDAWVLWTVVHPPIIPSVF